MAKDTFIKTKPHINSPPGKLEIPNDLWSIPEMSAHGQFEALNGLIISNASDRQAIAYILQVIAGSPQLKTNLQQAARLAEGQKTIIGGFKSMPGIWN